MNNYKRADKVSNLIHRVISDIIENEIRDNRIGMVTVTDVVMGNDLKNARVYVSVLGDNKNVELTISILNKAVGFIRFCVGEQVNLKNIPTLKFYYDSSIVDGIYMDKLLDEIDRES